MKKMRVVLGAPALLNIRWWINVLLPHYHYHYHHNLLLVLLLVPAIAIFSLSSANHHHGNPANDLVDLINHNRTAHRLPQLNDSPGLGCMALQYVELCKGNNCTGNSNAVNCKSPADDFTEIFAPNCGVELPTFGTITGHIVGCQSKYLEPSQAFARVLVKDNETLSVLRNMSHTEVGVGLVGVHKDKGPFFWCILFSDGKTNATFVLEDQGKGIKQKKGCYSGSSLPCSSDGGKQQATSFLLNNIINLVFLLVCLPQHLYQA